MRLPYEEFKTFGDASVDWYQKIIGDNTDSPIYTDCFLGLMADDINPLTHYAAALARNPQMIHEPCVRDYIHSLLDKYRNDFKCGKLFLNATYKFLVPDLIAFMEGAAGLPIVGCLKSDEFYSFDRRGVMKGKRVISRNPHLCTSEHAVLNAVDNDLTRKYFSHMVNAAIVNCWSVTAQRLNGADYDRNSVVPIGNFRI